MDRLSYSLLLIAAVACFAVSASADHCASYDSCSTCLASDDCFWCPTAQGSACMNSTTIVNDFDADIGNCTVHEDQCHMPIVPTITALNLLIPTNKQMLVEVDGVDDDVTAIGRNAQFAVSYEADEATMAEYGDVVVSWTYSQNEMDVTSTFLGGESYDDIVSFLWHPEQNLAHEFGLFRIEVTAKYANSEDVTSAHMYIYLTHLPSVTLSVDSNPQAYDETLVLSATETTEHLTGPLSYKFMVNDSQLSFSTPMSSVSYSDGLPVGTLVPKVVATDMVGRQSVVVASTVLTIAAPTFVDAEAKTTFLEAEKTKVQDAIQNDPQQGLLIAMNTLSLINEVSSEETAQADVTALTEVSALALNTIVTLTTGLDPTDVPEAFMADGLTSAMQTTLSFSGNADTETLAASYIQAAVQVFDVVDRTAEPMAEPENVLEIVQSLYNIFLGANTASVDGFSTQATEEDVLLGIALTGVQSMVKNVVINSLAIDSSFVASTEDFYVSIVASEANDAATVVINAASSAYSVTIPANTFTTVDSYQAAILAVPLPEAMTADLISPLAKVGGVAYTAAGAELNPPSLGSNVEAVIRVTGKDLSNGICAIYGDDETWDSTDCTSTPGLDGSISCSCSSFGVAGVLPGSSSSGLSGGAIAGIIVGVIVVAAVATFFILKSKKSHTNSGGNDNAREMRRMV